MALATRCPNCQAMFRVVSDQLKLRGGLVRCGGCRHVFDAIGSLSYIEDSALAPAPAPAARPAGEQAPPSVMAVPTSAGPSAQPAFHGHSAIAPSPPPTPGGVTMPSAHAAPSASTTPITAADGASARERARPLPEAIGAVAPTPTRDADAPPPADPLAVPTLLARDAETDAGGTPAPPADAQRAAETVNRLADAADERGPASEAPAPRPAPAAASRPRSATTADDDEETAEPEDVSFLKERRQPRGFSIVYGGGALLLGLLLLMQSAVLFRTELMMRWPELRPRLVDICEIYGCTVGWPTRADLLAVVGTELQAVPGTDILELTAVVRNRAPFRVALPAIEVTLTDTTNRALARKVFAPVDYLASSGEPSGRIGEGLGPGSDYVIRISFEARGLNAAGFVVYPFYL
jgi:predicted Zn finger-like uncharacterized protein